MYNLMCKILKDITVSRPFYGSASLLVKLSRCSRPYCLPSPEIHDRIVKLDPYSYQKDGWNKLVNTPVNGINYIPMLISLQEKSQ